MTKVIKLRSLGENKKVEERDQRNFVRRRGQENNMATDQSKA